MAGQRLLVELYQVRQQSGRNEFGPVSIVDNSFNDAIIVPEGRYEAGGEMCESEGYPSQHDIQSSAFIDSRATPFPHHSKSTLISKFTAEPKLNCLEKPGKGGEIQLNTDIKKQ